MHKCLSKLEIPDGMLKCRRNLNDFHIVHNHDFWEYMVICQGKYNQTINSTKYTMSINDAILIKPNDTHCVFPGNRDDYHLNIVINTDFLKSICSNFGESFYENLLHSPNVPISMFPNEAETIKSLISKIELAESEGEIVKFKKLLLTYIIELYYLRLLFTDKQYPTEISNLINDILSPQNLAMSVDDVAKISGYSYSYLAKIFKSYVGMSIKKYLIKHKMEYAMDELRRGNLSIIEISLNLGYNSFSSFMAAFKSATGMSPGQYRSLHSSNRNSE